MNASSNYGLSEEEINFFNQNGYIGPFDKVISDEKIDDICTKILEHSRNKEDRLY